MITVRRANERGHANHGWLDSHHSFSFADYYDPKHMGFRGLRVINEDRVAPAKGFGRHSHRDMEIISYVLEGALEHNDSMGTGTVIRPGDVQIMGAGAGVTHSEFNGSKDAPVHFLQIWILPSAQGLTPRYEQRAFAADHKRGKLCLVASPEGRDQSVMIRADVALYAGLFDRGERAALTFQVGRHADIHVACGKVKVNGQLLDAGDAAAFSEQSEVQIEGIDQGKCWYSILRELHLPKRKRRVLLLPGWMGSDQDHWQSHWEAVRGAVRVAQDDWSRPIPTLWVDRLESFVAREDGQVILVAHSLGCHLVSRWAIRSNLVHKVERALLVAPPDLERSDAPEALFQWMGHPLPKLPFPSDVVYSSDDPYCSVERSLAMATSWGARLHAVGAQGHLNSASGVGAWSQGWELLENPPIDP